MSQRLCENRVLRSYDDWYAMIKDVVCPCGPGWRERPSEHEKFCLKNYQLPSLYPCLCTVDEWIMEEVGLNYGRRFKYEYAPQLRAKLQLLDE